MATWGQGAFLPIVFPPFEAVIRLPSKQRAGQARAEANIKPVGFMWDVKRTTLPFTGCMTWDALLNLSSSTKQG